MISHKHIIYLSALSNMLSEGAMAEDKFVPFTKDVPLATMAQEVTKPIKNMENKIIEQIGLDGVSGRRISMDPDTEQQYKSRLSAAKSEIGNEGLVLAEKFRICVNFSTQNAGVEASPLELRTKIPDVEVIKNIATAECAAKVYGAPKGP